MAHAYPRYLIHTPGRVGSITLHRFVHRSFPGTSPAHRHCLQHEGEFPTYDPGYLEYLQTTTDDIYAFTIVRDPLRRNLSAFLYQSGKNMPGLIRSYNYETRVDNNDQPIIRDVEELMRKVEVLFMYGYKHNVFFQFNRKEIVTLYGINLYRQSFDTDNGYQVYHKDNKHLMVIRTENLSDEHIPAAIEDFVGIRRAAKMDMMTFNSSLSRSGGVGSLYSAFYKHAVLDEKFVNNIYDNQNTKTFYTEEEIERMKSRWLDKKE